MQPRLEFAIADVINVGASSSQGRHGHAVDIVPDYLESSLGCFQRERQPDIALSDHYKFLTHICLPRKWSSARFDEHPTESVS